VGIREGTAVAETHIGPEDPAATIAPAAPLDPAAGPAGRREHETRPQRGGWLVIAVPAATSAVVGGYELGDPSLWRDEAYTKDAIGRSVSQIFALLGHQDAVHGAYYLFMHVIVAVIGTSATALRFPSLCAMVIATGFTAAIGRRAAALAQAPKLTQAPKPRQAPRLTRAPNAEGASRVSTPALTGLLAGLVFATAPYMTFYAQTARSYAIVTMFATIASYLLLRAYPDGRWRWWSAYGAAIALTGLFNLFALLILVAHGVTLLLTDARGQPGSGQPGRSQPGSGRWIGRLPARWLAVSAAALIVLGPLLRVASGQQVQIDWLTRPEVVLTGVACAILFSLVNTGIVAVAAHLAEPEAPLSGVLWDKESLLLDLTETCVGILVAITCALSPLLLLVALPPVILLQRSLMHQQLQAAARTDAKTGLLNAAAWQREADAELTRALRADAPVAVLLIDVDHFKRVNDTHGHLVGDEVLKCLAAELRQQVRDSDVVGRFGGEEFTVLLPRTDANEALRIAERLRRSASTLSILASEVRIGVTISIGVAVLGWHGRDLFELLAAADLALYRAKDKGRNRVCLYGGDEASDALP